MLEIIIRKVANFISYIISWLGLKLFHEVYIYADENDRVQGLLFTNDPRHIMLLKGNVIPITNLIDQLSDKISILEEKLIETGGVIDYGKIDRDKEAENV